MFQIAKLTAQFRAESGNLRCTYSIANRHAHPIFVVNVALDVRSDGVHIHERPIVEYRRGSVVLYSALAAPKRDTSYTAPPKSYARLLEPKQVWHGNFSLKLPLVPYNWIQPQNTQEMHEIECRNIIYIMGVIPQESVSSAVCQSIAGTALWRLPSDAYMHQKLVELKAVVEGVSVLTRT